MRLLTPRDQRSRRGPLTFEPRRVGELECTTWAAYYRREWLRFLVASLQVVRVGFGFGPLRTLQGAWFTLRANQMWAPYPDNDPDAARQFMTRFYELAGRSGQLSIDPQKAAQLEVEWWRVHRAHQHDAGVGESALVEALTALYSYVYALSEDAVAPAALARTEAMRYSDAWVDAGCDPADSLLVDERRALVACYTALRAAIDAPASA